MNVYSLEGNAGPRSGGADDAGRCVGQGTPAFCVLAMRFKSDNLSDLWHFKNINFIDLSRLKSANFHIVKIYSNHRRHLDLEERQMWSVKLRQKGMSYRAIGETLGVDAATVMRDVRQSTVENATVPLPDTITGKDGKVRPAVMPAERRIGELLGEMEKNKGQLFRGSVLKPRDNTPTLSDLGISKAQSSRWQSEAGGQLFKDEKFPSPTRRTQPNCPTSDSLPRGSSCNW